MSNSRHYGDNILIAGATSTIAQEAARLLAARHHTFCLVDRDAIRLEAVAADLRARGAKDVHTIVSDLGDFASHPQLLQAIQSKLPSLDTVLVAWGILGNPEECVAETRFALENLRVNFVSVISFLTPIANLMTERRRGSIVVISSVAGDRGRQSHYTYNAAKGGLTVWLQGLRNRLHKHNVHVLTIKPGMVDTPMTAHMKKGLLFSKPATIGKGLVRALDKRRDTAYIPCYWRLIMLIIIHIPEFIFKRMKL
jgi:short-subunit dehydrogenase